MLNLDKSKGFSVIGVIIIIAFIGGILFLLQKAFTGPKRVCPDQWVINRSDKAADKEEYLVVDGKRAEPENYDLKWIRENCSITNPEAGYY